MNPTEFGPFDFSSADLPDESAGPSFGQFDFSSANAPDEEPSKHSVFSFDTLNSQLRPITQKPADSFNWFMGQAARTGERVGWLQEQGASMMGSAIKNLIPGDMEDAAVDTLYGAQEDLAQRIQTRSKESSDYWLDQVSTEFRAKAEAGLDDPEFGVTTLYAAALGSLPEMMMTMGSGAIAGKLTHLATSVGASRIAAAAAQGSPLASKMLSYSKYAPAIGGAVAGGTTEGMLAAGATGVAMEERVNAMSHEELMSGSDRYLAVYESAQGMDEDARRAYAKRTVAEELGRTTASWVGLSTAALGAPTGAMMGYVAGRAAGAAGIGGAVKKLEGSVAGQAATGFAAEGAQEFMQEGSQTFLSNLGLREYANKSQSLSEGVLDNAVIGGLVGGIMGGSITPLVGAGARAQARGESAADESTPKMPEAKYSRNPLLEAKIVEQIKGLEAAGVPAGEFQKVARWAGQTAAGGRSALEFSKALEELAETGAAPENVVAMVGEDFDDDGVLTEAAYTKDAARLDFAVEMRIKPGDDMQRAAVFEALGKEGANPYQMGDGTLVVPQSEPGRAGLQSVAAALQRRLPGIAVEIVNREEDQAAESALTAEGSVSTESAEGASGAEASDLLTAPDANIPEDFDKEIPGLDAKYSLAAKSKPVFDSVLHSVAKSIGATARIPAELKGGARASEKIRVDYGGDSSRIKDLVRGTIQVESVEEASAAVEALRSAFDVLPTGYRDTINDESGVGPDQYRDIKLNVDLGDGLVGEVQVSLTPLLDAKHDLHPLYKRRESIVRAAEGRDLTPEETVEVDNLNKQMAAGYASAFAKSLSAPGKSSSKRSAETTAPLRYMESMEKRRGASPSNAQAPSEPDSDLTSATGTPSTSQSRSASIESPPESDETLTQVDAPRKSVTVKDEAGLEEMGRTAASHPESGRDAPTERQLRAGNYPKGHGTLKGATSNEDVPVSIENVPGSIRRGLDAKWSRKMKHWYGYIRGTKHIGDGKLDVYIGRNAHDSSLPVFVVHQNNVDGTFDEPKVVMGYKSEGEAKAAYLSEYPANLGPKLFGGISRLSREQFAEYIDSGRTDVPPNPMTKRPMAELKPQFSVAMAEAKGVTDDPVTLRTFYENPKRAFTAPGWAVITATRESAGEANSVANLESNRDLERNLKARGIKFFPVKGSYQGVDQGKNFLIIANERTAIELGAFYGQESVLTNRGLVYMDGRLTPAVHGNDIVGRKALKEDFYSELPNGTAFSLGLDFDATGTDPKPRVADEEIVASVSYKRKRKAEARAATEETQSRDEWFNAKESNLVNEDGTPMLIYHGTKAKVIGQFKRSKTGAMGPAVYTSPYKEVAEAYADGGTVMELYVRGKYMDNMKWTKYIEEHGWSGAEAAAKADGWDGVFDTMFEDAVAVWDPSNIKQVNEVETRPRAEGLLSLANRKQTDTEAFKAWFGDSKVVDANGEPLVVYHGTTADFDTFAGGPAWFHSDPSQAFASGEGARIVPAYVRIERPIYRRGYFGMEDFSRPEKFKFYDKAAEEWVTPDGVIGDNGVVVAFRPEQIKSATANRGTFDPNNPSILASIVEPNAMRARPTYEDAVKIVERTVAPLKGAPEVVVHAGETDLPRHLHNQIVEYGAQGMVEGLYDPFDGKVHIIPRNVLLREGEDFSAAVQRIVAEETMGHFGLNAVFGTKQLNRLLDEVWRDAKATPRMKSIIRDYGDVYGDINDTSVQRRMANEYLSKLDPGDRPTLWQKAVAWLREALRNLGYVREWSDNDLKVLMERVFDAVRSGHLPTSLKRLNRAMLTQDGDDVVTAHVKGRTVEYDGATRRITSDNYRATLEDGMESGMPAADVSSFSGDLRAFMEYVAEEGKRVIVAPESVITADMVDGMDTIVDEGARIVRIPDELVHAERKETASMFSLRNRAKGSADVEAILEKTVQEHVGELGWGQRFNQWFRELVGYFGSGDTWAELKTGWIDSAQAIEKLERAQFNGKLLDAAESAYKMVSLTKNLPQVMSAISKVGVPQFKDGSFVRVNGRKGLYDIFGPLFRTDDGKNLLHLWEGYAIARRSSQLIDQTNPDGTSKEKLLTRQEIDTLLELERQYPVFRKVFDEWQEFNKQLLELAVDRGALSREMADLWMQNDYVPFYRVDEEEDVAAGIVRKRGLSGQKVTSKRLTGSDKRIQPVLENIMLNTASIIEKVYKNEAMNRIVAIADGVAMTKEPLRVEAVKFTNEDLARALKKAGLFVGDDSNSTPLQRKAGKLLRDNDIDYAVRAVENMTPEQRERWTTLFRRVRPDGKDVVSVMVAGKPVWYRVHDPLVLRAIMDMTPVNFGALVDFMGGAKRLLTTMVTLDPGFMMANYMRDTLSTWAVSDEDFRPFRDAPKGAAEIWTDSGLATDLAIAGGMTGGFFDPTQDFADVVNEVTDPGVTVLNSPKKLLDAYRRIGMVSEQVNRLAVAKAVLRRGGSLAEAAYQAQDVLNFSQSGDAVAAQLLIRTVPFLNARIQGLYRLWKGARGLDRPEKAKLGFFMKGLFLAGISMLLALKNMGDERYEKLPDFQKDTYWHFFVNGDHYAIPKPFEVGVLFATLPERAMRLVAGSDSGKTTANSITRALGDTFAFNPVPQLFKPIVEQWANRSFFTDRPIVGLELEGLEPVAQYNPWTSETARMVATGIDAVVPDSMQRFTPETLRSPTRLEHAMRAYMGTVGGYLLQLSDAALRAAGAFPEAPSMASIRDVPVVGGAAGRFARGPSELETSSKYADDLYDALARADDAYRTLNAYVRQGNIEAAAALADRRMDELSVRPILHDFREAAAELNTQQRFIMQSDLPPEEKRAQLDELTRTKNEIMKEAVPYLALLGY